MPAERVELEANDSVDDVLAGYDREHDRWSFTFESDFWRAVRHAHGLGRRGAGERIAIVDSACDLSIPRLASCVEHSERTASGTLAGPTEHGSAVALLISAVGGAARAL